MRIKEDFNVLNIHLDEGSYPTYNKFACVGLCTDELKARMQEEEELIITKNVLSRMGVK